MAISDKAKLNNYAYPNWKRCNFLDFANKQTKKSLIYIFNEDKVTDSLILIDSSICL